MKLFSKRHRKSLASGSLTVGLGERLRGRIWMELTEHNASWHETDDTNWTSEVSVLDKVAWTLKRLYGTDSLLPASMPIDPDSHEAKRDALKWHVALAPSAEVLDVVEVTSKELEEELSREKRDAFQRAINSAFEDEACPWRVSDGSFFKVDSEFLENHVLAETQQLLSADGFNGAQDEFIEARHDLVSGDHKDTILKACKSMESVLKVITGDQGSNASVRLCPCSP